MKCVSWNVNSVRIRIPSIFKLIMEENPDVILLQEIKCIDSSFPIDAFPGYNCIVFGQKSYNGVAIIIKANIKTYGVQKIEIAGVPDARYLQVQCDHATFVSVYVPCGGGSIDKLNYKIRFLDELAVVLKLIDTNKVIVGGDFNVAIEDVDVQYPTMYLDTVLCIPQVRSRMQKIIDHGFIDHKNMLGIFTWWDYRRPYHGLRLDYILTRDVDNTQYALQNYRRLLKPSDHVPVCIHFD